MNDDFDHGRNGLESELLEFERELRREEKSRSLKRWGTVAGGVVAVLLLAWLLGRFEDAQEEVTDPLTAVQLPEDAGQAPLDDRLATLQQENLIGHDTAAPGTGDEAVPRKVEPELTAMDRLAAPDEGPESVPPSEMVPVLAPAAEGVAATEPVLAEAEGNEPPAVEVTLRDTEPAPEAAPAVEAAAEQSAPAPDVVAVEPEPDVKPAPRAATPPGGAPYAVQLLATTDADAALRLRDELLERRSDAWIAMGKVKRDRYRVEAGRYRSIREAATMTRALSEEGIRSRVGYVEGGKGVTVILGESDLREAADRIAGKARQAGFTPSVVRVDEPMPLYMVRVGRFPTVAAAIAESARLQQLGHRLVGVVSASR